MSVTDRTGDPLIVGDLVIVDRDLYEIEAIDEETTILYLVEIGRLTSFINPYYRQILAKYTDKFVI